MEGNTAEAMDNTHKKHSKRKDNVMLKGRSKLVIELPTVRADTASPTSDVESCSGGATQIYPSTSHTSDN